MINELWGSNFRGKSRDTLDPTNAEFDFGLVVSMHRNQIGAQTKHHLMHKSNRATRFASLRQMTQRVTKRFEQRNPHEHVLLFSTFPRCPLKRPDPKSNKHCLTFVGLGFNFCHFCPFELVRQEKFVRAWAKKSFTKTGKIVVHFASLFRGAHLALLWLRCC